MTEREDRPTPEESPAEPDRPSPPPAPPPAREPAAPAREPAPGIQHEPEPDGENLIPAKDRPGTL